MTNWAQTLGGEEFSLQEAIGGIRGVIESLLPGLVFVVTYLVTGSLGWTVGLAAGISVLFVVIRAFQRSAPTQAIAGLIGVAIGVVWAFTSGRTENYYAWGILLNLVYAAVIACTILIRQPLGALLIQFLWGLPKGWKKEEHYALLYRRAWIATWVWVVVFCLRVAVKAPLYYSGQVAALGIATLVMGLPLFALGAWLTWVLLRGLLPTGTASSSKEVITED